MTNQPPPGLGQRLNWLVPWLLGLNLFLIYSLNGREVGGGDTVPATLLPLSIIRGEGPYLDRFAPSIRDPLGRIPGYGTESRGHAVSRYPLGPALVALPFEWPQLLVLDLLQPGWDSDPDRAIPTLTRLGKNAAAAIAALTAVVLMFWLKRLGFGQLALAVVLAASLGTDQWSTGSQALWQHGPAMLCFSLALWALTRPTPGLSEIALSGFALAMMVACRPIDLVFVLPITAWVRFALGRRLFLAFGLAGLVVALPLAVYNVWFFKTLSGGYAQIEQMHPWAHGVRGTWTGALGTGMLGTLLSPSHGLFVYCPWVFLAIFASPRVLRTSGWKSLEGALLAGLLANLVLLSKYSCWWAGHCFGPRFWIDATPILALLLAHALNQDAGRLRLRWYFFWASLVISLALQAVGFLCYPSTWHGQPTNSDLDHARLWDWRDTEVSRGLSEGIKPRNW